MRYIIKKPNQKIIINGRNIFIAGQGEINLKRESSFKIIPPLINPEDFTNLQTCLLKAFV